MEALLAAAVKVGVVCMCTYILVLGVTTISARRTTKNNDKKLLPVIPEVIVNDEIEPLSDFDWSTTEPKKYRPFKPLYHLTMAVQNTTISDLIEMDKNYLERITLRRQIMRDHEATVLGADPVAKEAVDEFYTFLVRRYLPTRFPRMFQLTNDGSLYNSVLQEKLCLTPPQSPVDTLRIVGGLIEEDCLFLLPSNDGDGYTLKAFVTCFPNGFDTSKKIGLKLRDIHIPVPNYKEKLEKSMDRFMERLPVGKVIKRSNWGITTTDTLLAASGTHAYEGEEITEEEIDPVKTRVRSERQVVHRLPETKAIMFTFKTYLYPLQDIKDEGLGEDLAQAIDGLKQGSVPGFWRYKRAIVWGESAKRFLRAQ